MGKIAFVFAGQGAQCPGMGQELAQCSPAAAQVFQQLDALRPGTSQQCFSGTEAELKETRNTQPCMFAVELAAAAALEEKNAERQKTEQHIAQSVLDTLAADPSYETDRILVVWGEGYHQGVIGIVASRMVEKFGKPAIVTDTHCIRLVNRMGLVDGIKDPKKVEMALWKLVPAKEGSDFCHRLVYHGRDVCTARTRPHCDACCLGDICARSGI